MSNPKISIIIPIYNGEKYLEKCFESILNNSYDNLEIIPINDGSKDKSQDIIDKYKEKYPDLFFPIKQENKGAAQSRNIGINKSTGDYITFIDNDDFVDKDYIKTLVDNTEDGKIDIVISGYRRPDNNGKIVDEIKLKDYEYCKMLILTPWAKIYKRKYLIDNKIEFLNNNIGEDMYFYLLAVFQTEKIKILDYVGYNWFYNIESVSNSKQKDFEKLDVFNLLNSCYDSLKEKELIEKNYQIIELMFYRYIVWFLYFASKGHTRKERNLEYDKLFAWLKERFPKYKSNKLLRITQPKGDRFKVRIIYTVFRFFDRLHLGKLIVNIYCKVF